MGRIGIVHRTEGLEADRMPSQGSGAPGVSPSLFMGCQSKRAARGVPAGGAAPRSHPLCLRVRLSSGPSLGHCLVRRCERRLACQVSVYLAAACGTLPSGSAEPGTRAAS